MLPALPGLGADESTARGSGCSVGLAPVPAGRAREDLPDRLPRRLPAREARGARAGAAKDFGPLLADLGRGDARARRRRTTSAARSSTSGSSWRCSTSRPAARSSSLAGLALFVGGAALVYHYVAARPGARRRSGSTRGRTTGLLRAHRRARVPPGLRVYQLVQSALLDRATAASAAPGSARARSRRPTATPLIPYLNTDFIYSAIAQELGLIGAAGAAARLHALRRARLPRSRCSQTTASRSCSPPGSTFGFALQTFIIVGGVLRVIPLTGITLPFVSYGGSSVVANFILLALLLLVSNRANAGARAAREQADHARSPSSRVVLLVALIVATTYWQAWAAGRPRRPAGQRDPSGSRSSRSTAGDLRGRRRHARATNREREGRRPDALLPRYPQGGLAAHVVGYSTQARSRTGLERSLNDYLTGVEREPLHGRSTRRSTSSKGKTIQGNDVVRLTLDAERAARRARALGRRCGAVVALDPRPGRCS